MGEGAEGAGGREEIPTADANASSRGVWSCGRCLMCVPRSFRLQASSVRMPPSSGARRWARRWTHAARAGWQPLARSDTPKSRSSAARSAAAGAHSVGARGPSMADGGSSGTARMAASKDDVASSGRPALVACVPRQPRRRAAATPDRPRPRRRRRKRSASIACSSAAYASPWRPRSPSMRARRAAWRAIASSSAASPSRSVDGADEDADCFCAALRGKSSAAAASHASSSVIARVDGAMSVARGQRLWRRHTVLRPAHSPAIPSPPFSPFPTKRFLTQGEGEREKGERGWEQGGQTLRAPSVAPGIMVMHHCWCNTLSFVTCYTSHSPVFPPTSPPPHPTTTHTRGDGSVIQTEAWLASGLAP